ncbi:hypothetical protein ACQ4PT_054781 [Festuca glaucescens]
MKKATEWKRWAREEKVRKDGAEPGHHEEILKQGASRVRARTELDNIEEEKRRTKLGERTKKGRLQPPTLSECLGKEGLRRLRPDDGVFTVEVHHGGFFCGLGRNSDEEGAAICEYSDCESIDDLDFNDSDYDFDDDDCLFDENVDVAVANDLVGKKRKQYFPKGEDDVPDEDELQRFDEPKYNCKYYNPATDKDNHVFKLGMVFPSAKDFRKALAMYVVNERHQVKKTWNNSTRVEAQCCEGCPWKIIATKDSRYNALFSVKTFNDVHDCERVWDVKEMTHPFLTDKFIEEFRINEKLSLKGFAEKVQIKYNMEPSRFKLARARLAALKKVHGDEVAQFSYLWDYGEELRRANPGTSYYLKSVGNSFSCMYISLDAMKRGWLRGCRPIICLDGTHIKTKFGGQLLTAVGIDPNDCIYPIAMAIVEVECYSSWLWFLSTFKNDLNIVNTSPFTIMSDKQKGLIKAVLELFPDSEHRFCVRHLHQNMSQLHKGEVVKNHVWACARSTNVAKWTENMEKFKDECPEAHAWLEEMPPNTWCRALFSDFPKCDILLNNSCEVFNRWILEARELPVLSMLERIICQIMTRNYEKEKEGRETWTGLICPKIKKKLDKNSDLAALYTPKPAGARVFKVGSSPKTIYIVELNLRSCTCKRWQLTGIPCAHAIACLRHEKIKLEKLVADCYSIQTFMKAYGTHVRSVRDRKEWKKLNGPEVKPPYYEKVVGRPRKNRRKAPEEKQNGTKLSKAGVQMHCSYCREADHNKAGCELLEADEATQQGDAAAATRKSTRKRKKTAKAQQNEEDNVDSVQKPNRRKRRTCYEQVSQPNPTREPTIIDEHGDADVPAIREHIVHVDLDPARDPTNLQDSMVSILANEEPSVVITDYEPIPEESTFVAEHREYIPVRAGLTTATSAGYAILRGKQKTRGKLEIAMF